MREYWVQAINPAWDLASAINGTLALHGGDTKVENIFASVDGGFTVTVQFSRPHPDATPAADHEGEAHDGD